MEAKRRRDTLCGSFLVNYVGCPNGKMFVHRKASYFATPAPFVYFPLIIYLRESARGGVE